MRRVAFILSLLLPITGFAQHLTLDVTTEAAVGTGSYSAVYLTSNRHGILSTNANTAYLRPTLKWGQQVGNWNLEACADLQAQLHTDNAKFYAQQLYLKANWSWLNFCAGTREITPIFRDFRLSSGGILWSGNARPIPGLSIGSHGFVDIPGTRSEVQFIADGFYGYYMDEDYTKGEYEKYLVGKEDRARSFITTGYWSHIKRLAIRTSTRHHFIFSIGIEHSVMFGGSCTNYVDPECNGTYNPKAKDFLMVLIPLAGSSSSALGDQAFFYGSHEGSVPLNFEYQWGGSTRNQYKLSLCHENIFEDGSGMYKGNGWDGMWGLEYHNRKPHSLISGAVFEYFHSTDQSGPIHWDPKDFGPVYGDKFREGKAHGNDNYFNNFFFNAYAHYGQVCGTPMIKSPAYNDDHYLCVTDNRIRAFHIGIEGEIPQLSSFISKLSSPSNGTEGILSYRILSSYRRSWGTNPVPAPAVRHSFDFLGELTLQLPRWTITTALGLDRGDLYGDNTTFDLRISRHFSLK